jgi:pyrroline-5-carboxylate reductase
MSAPLTILLIGCGKMGGALLAGWARQSALSCDVFIVEPGERPAPPPERAASLTNHYFRSLADVPESVRPQVVLFAVKPQTLGVVAAPAFARFGAAPLYLTIAAGKPIAWYREQMHADARLVRAMPNTPALIGRGVTALAHSGNVTEADRQIAQHLMEACGIALWLQDEGQMDVATAISGSGPAYVFYFMECLIRAAMDHGLEEELARRLVVQTVQGSGALAGTGEETLGMLRRNVTSPGGTTEAALEYLMNPSGLLPLVQQAVEAAIERARQIAVQK